MDGCVALRCYSVTFVQEVDASCSSTGVSDAVLMFLAAASTSSLIASRRLKVMGVLLFTARSHDLSSKGVHD